MSSSASRARSADASRSTGRDAGAVVDGSNIGDAAGHFFVADTDVATGDENELMEEERKAADEAEQASRVLAEACGRITAADRKQIVTVTSGVRELLVAASAKVDPKTFKEVVRQTVGVVREASRINARKRDSPLEAYTMPSVTEASGSRTRTRTRKRRKRQQTDQHTAVVNATFAAPSAFHSYGRAKQSAFELEMRRRSEDVRQTLSGDGGFSTLIVSDERERALIAQGRARDRLNELKARAKKIPKEAKRLLDDAALMLNGPVIDVRSIMTALDSVAAMLGCDEP